MTACQANITDRKMIIDKSYYSEYASVTIWVDAGTSGAGSIDSGLAEQLVRCVKDNAGNWNFHTFSHNTYAEAVAYENDQIYDEY